MICVRTVVSVTFPAIVVSPWIAEVKLSEQWNLNYLKYVQETTGEEADLRGDDAD